MSRRDQIRMTDAEVREFLTQSRTLIVCSNGARGWPHPVAMWFLVDEEGGVRMTTYTKSQKVLNLRRDPRVTLLVEAGKRYEELTGAVMYGRAEITEDTDRVLETLLAVTAKHRPEDDVTASSMREVMRGQAAKRVEIRVVPERVVSWNHTKLGGVY